MYSVFSSEVFMRDWFHFNVLVAWGLVFAILLGAIAVLLSIALVCGLINSPIGGTP